MKKSELKENYLDENTFWHITSKLNIESIKKNGLVPRNGKRNGKLVSAEDPVSRVFFSQGLEGVLGQANNLASIIDGVVKNIEKTSNGDEGKSVKEKMQEFINDSLNSEIEKIGLKNIAKIFAKDKDVALKKEEARNVFEELENEHIQESPSLSE